VGLVVQNEFNSISRFIQRRNQERTLVYNYYQNQNDMENARGVSAFISDAKGDVFHTYSSYARGIDMSEPSYNFPT